MENTTQQTEYKEGVCPICGSTNIEYSALEINDMDNSVFYPCTCNNCDSEWEEYYILTFSNHENIVKG